MDDGSRRKIAQHGPLTLARRGDVWEILWEGTFLMSSECRASESELGALARGRTLVGGLGMGFTLRAALDAGAREIDVVEISGAVIEWNRGPLGELAGRPLEDERVRVHEADIAAFVRTARDYDAILLDVDNGPSWIARPENAALYGDQGMAALRAALAPGGVIGIWSAQREPGLRGEERAIPAARGTADYVYVLGSLSTHSRS